MLLSCTYLFPFPKAAGHRLVWAVRLLSWDPTLQGSPLPVSWSSRRSGGRHGWMEAPSPAGTASFVPVFPKAQVVVGRKPLNTQ